MPKRFGHCLSTERGISITRTVRKKFDWALLLNYDAAEGTGAVIPCRLCTSSRQVVKQMASLAVVLIGGAARNDRKMGVTMVAQPATLVDGLLLLDYDVVEGIQNQ